jgi:hypothetical protein
MKHKIRNGKRENIVNDYFVLFESQELSNRKSTKCSFNFHFQFAAGSLFVPQKYFYNPWKVNLNQQNMIDWKFQCQIKTIKYP